MVVGVLRVDNCFLIFVVAGVVPEHTRPTPCSGMIALCHESSRWLALICVQDGFFGRLFE